MWKKHPRAQAGQLRDRVTLLVATQSKDGANQTIRSWAPEFTDIPASKEIVSGGESLRGRQLEAGVTVVFTMRDIGVQITPLMMLRHQEENLDYGIVKVEPADDRGQFLLIQCKRSANNG